MKGPRGPLETVTPCGCSCHAELHSSEQPHRAPFQQDEAEQQRPCEAGGNSSLLSVQTRPSSSTASSADLCVHVKNLHLGPASWFSPNQGFSHLPCTRSTHTVACRSAYSMEMKSTQLRTGYYSPMTASALWVLQAFGKAVSPGATSLSHIHI